MDGGAGVGMTRAGRPVPGLEFETFGVAVGCALVSGALSLAAPFLDALTGALAALAVAGWLSALRRRRSSSGEWLQLTPLAAISTLGLAAGLFLFAPGAVAPFRGLLLALGLLPLWLVERRRRSGPRPGPGGP